MSRKIYTRTPQNYDGTKPTSHLINDLLPHALEGIGSEYQKRGDLILAMWPEIIGPKLALMTEAVSFSEGFLYINVKNSTLYSLLSQNERPRLLKLLRQKFPQAQVQGIFFRIG